MLLNTKYYVDWWYLLFKNSGTILGTLWCAPFHCPSLFEVHTDVLINHETIPKIVYLWNRVGDFDATTKLWLWVYLNSMLVRTMWEWYNFLNISPKHCIDGWRPHFVGWSAYCIIYLENDVMNQEISNFMHAWWNRSVATNNNRCNTKIKSLYISNHIPCSIEPCFARDSHQKLPWLQ